MERLLRLTLDAMTFDTTKDIVFTDGVSKTTITAAVMASGSAAAGNAVGVSLLANSKFQAEGVDLNLTVVPAVAQAFSTGPIGIC